MQPTPGDELHNLYLSPNMFGTEVVQDMWHVSDSTEIHAKSWLGNLKETVNFEDLACMGE